jgi:hypothetical protein
MKDVLSVVTFVMGALGFAMFLITVKPDALSAVPSPGKLTHCKLAVSREPVVPVGNVIRLASEAESRNVSVL